MLASPASAVLLLLPLLLLLLLLLPMFSLADDVVAFDGQFFSGREALSTSGGSVSHDLSFLQLLDVARRQYSGKEFEFQSVDLLYRGDWDGILEGPTWGACR
jgi:hypothetical protein